MKGLLILGFLCFRSADCGFGFQCERTRCGGTACVRQSFSACVNTYCPPDTECLDTVFGPICLRVTQPVKPGFCPNYSCPPYFYPPCLNSCNSDYDCGGSLKCCVLCNGCRRCVNPIFFAQPFGGQRRSAGPVQPR